MCVFVGAFLCLRMPFQSGAVARTLEWTYSGQDEVLEVASACRSLSLGMTRRLAHIQGVQLMVFKLVSSARAGAGDGVLTWRARRPKRSSRTCATIRSAQSASGAPSRRWRARAGLRGHVQRQRAQAGASFRRRRRARVSGRHCCVRPTCLSLCRALAACPIVRGGGGGGGGSMF